MSTNKNTVIINLEESNNAQYYNLSLNTSQSIHSTLIHYEEAEKVFDHLNEFIKIAKESKNKEKDKLYQHNTITILGPRGSGKTSFLLSIKHALTNNEDNDWTKLGKEIEVLKIIDPTLIEEKGHVFLNVIALIKNLVDNKVDIHFERNEYQLNSDKLEWEKQLEKLSAGIPSIDGKIDQINDGWQDPEFVMENGLKAVEASIHLLQNFSDFLKLSLKILKKEAFLLLFDDIDVDAKKGFTVLETIRKYFNSSNLITIMSGDLEMYTLVVRQNKWKNFGEEILKFEGQYQNRIPYFNKLVTELESQYLQKILKPRYRIHLPTTKELISRNQVIEITSDKEANQSIKIKEVYTNIFRSIGINNEFQSETYTNFFLNLPLRSQVQFLSFFNIETGELNAKKNLSDIASVFLSDLYAQEINVDLILRNPKNTNALILNFLVKEKRLEELYQLQPVTQDESLNASLVTLNFILSKNISQDPFLIFDYFIKVGYVRNLIPLLEYDSENHNKNIPSIEGLLERSVLLNDNVLKDITGRIIAYVRGSVHFYQNKQSEIISKAGTIPLFGTEASAKGKKSSSGRIDAVLKNNRANQEDAYLVLFPASVNQYTYKQSSLITYSSILLLAGIGELIRKLELNDEKNGYNELSQLRSFMMPDFVKGMVDDKIDNDDDDDILDEYTELEEFKILEEFKLWKELFDENQLKVSTQLLGKIMTRFFFALSNMESNVRNRNLGDVFHAHIIAFMNAVLIEDFRENAQEITNLNNNNSNYNNKIFSNNLDKAVKETRDKTAFSRWVLSCPLLLVYLKKNSSEDKKLIQNILTYCGLTESNSSKRNIQKYLSLISIRQNNESIKNENLKNEDLKNENLNIKNYSTVYTLLTNNEITKEALLDMDDTSLTKILNENQITVKGKSINGFKNFLTNLE
jgi:hypothetical protein